MALMSPLALSNLMKTLSKELPDMSSEQELILRDTISDAGLRSSRVQERDNQRG